MLALVVGISWHVTSIREVAHRRFLGGEEVTTANRVEIWLSEWARAKAKPWFGHGLGTLSEHYGTETVMGHNSYISVAVEGGMINMVVFTLTVLVTLIGGYFRLRHLTFVPDQRIGWLLVAVAFATR